MYFYPMLIKGTVLRYTCKYFFKIRVQSFIFVEWC